jgi:hypothetical protein
LLFVVRNLTIAGMTLMSAAPVRANVVNALI